MYNVIVRENKSLEYRRGGIGVKKIGKIAVGIVVTSMVLQSVALATTSENTLYVKEKGNTEMVVMYTDYAMHTGMEQLRNYGIISGDPDGNMRPYSFITRAEFSKVLCKMLNIEPTDTSVALFGDVTEEDWFCEYVTTAFRSGIVEGCDNGNFEPEREVTYGEALKMIVSAMGYASEAEQVGGYPYGYAKIAGQLGITNGLDYALSLQVKRHLVFEMLNNAMDVPFMLIDANGKFVIADGMDGSQYVTFRSKITGQTTRNDAH